MQVHAENLREHRRGLLVDIVTDVNVGNETAWHQVTTFLHQQKTSLSDEPKPPPQKQPKLGPPNAVLRITPGQIRHYASVGGDHNPIHTNPIAAKLFGFPTVIAHGMFTAAAVLANIEGQLPDAVKYSVRFAKPVVLPARAGLYVDRISERLGAHAAPPDEGRPAPDGHGAALLALEGSADLYVGWSRIDQIGVDVLRLVQSLVEAALGHQRAVVAHLCNASVLEDQYSIRNRGNEIHVMTDRRCTCDPAHSRGSRRSALPAGRRRGFQSARRAATPRACATGSAPPR